MTNGVRVGILPYSQNKAVSIFSDRFGSFEVSLFLELCLEKVLLVETYHT